MVILTMPELTSDVLKIRKILRTITHLYSKILSQFFSRTPHARVQGETLIKNMIRRIKRHPDMSVKLL